MHNRGRLTRQGEGDGRRDKQCKHTACHPQTTMVKGAVGQCFHCREKESRPGGRSAGERKKQVKSMRRCAALIVFLGVLGSSFSEAGIYAKKLGTGTVDWSNRVVEAIGIGTPPRSVQNQAQARALAAQQARTRAARQMLRTLKMVPVDCSHLVNDIAVNDASQFRQLKNMVYHAAEKETFFLSGNRVKKVLTVGIRGDLADILLPGNIREIKDIRGEAAEQKEKLTQSEKKKSFTGLVLDCRGLKVAPALVPRVLDEEGKEIYGPAIVTRRFALRKGVAGYDSEIEKALHDPRIGSNPLRVKAVRVSGANSCDIVISNADAHRILEAPENLDFLRRASVIIVLD